MAIGERIHFFRILRGMTQKYLGTVIGFDDNSADVRIAQYETGKRKPKELYLNKIAEKLGVSPQALDVPNIDSYEGLMHTLFALEDIYGLRIDKLDDELCISIKKVNNPDYKQLRENFDSWYEQANKLRNEKITKDEYDEWRYHYTQKDNTSGIHASVPSQAISDLFSTPEK
ncbi:XRE family transcriptional regulator [Enterocloster aldenensis]|uniref:helix-turn-helix domain-containing protein n=1 Tax=Enterocloster aldenensis TaxID=358742 RepID=UPI000E410519|nr:XRE family transcriptional regulator [Enterocloster aldenensis]